MGLVVIFGLVTLVAAFALFRELSKKNFLAIVFSVLTVGVFGWFTVKTLISILFPESK